MNLFRSRSPSPAREQERIETPDASMTLPLTQAEGNDASSFSSILDTSDNDDDVKSSGTSDSDADAKTSSPSSRLVEAFRLYISCALSDLSGASQYHVQSRVPLDDLCALLTSLQRGSASTSNNDNGPSSYESLSSLFSPMLNSPHHASVPTLSDLCVESTMVAIMNLELHSASFMLEGDANSLNSNARSKTMVQIINKFLSIAFSLFPVSEMYAVIRLSPGLINQCVFQGIGMDGACGDVLSYLAVTFDIIFKSSEGSGGFNGNQGGGSSDTTSTRARSSIIDNNSGNYSAASSATKVLLAEMSANYEDDEVGKTL